MKNLTTYLFVIFMAMFWIFRLIVAFCASLGIKFAVTPLDMNYEIILLFLTFISMILVVKRNMLGAIIYLIGNEIYFGTSLFGILSKIIQGSTQIDIADAFFSFIGVALPILILFDLLLDKNRKANPVDKKTDWFFKNKAFDRKYDERADKNQYKF